MANEQDAARILSFVERIRDNVEKVFLGKREVVELVAVAMLSRGHVLLEDVPGTGKTILARAFAASIGAGFARIQCTPDLLPADVTGVSVWSPSTQEFLFRKGPVMNQFVLVDEINRATPRTQSALLEAMAENQVSVEGQRIALPEPFFLIATENPIEFEGTFPLPEAQKDRFLLTGSIGYPSSEAEALMLESQRRTRHPVEDLTPVAEAAELLDLQAAVAGIHVDPAIRTYILALVEATRTDSELRLGVSPRGSLALYRSAQAAAAMRGRSYVVPEDVKGLAQAVFRQRVILGPEAQVRGVRPERIIAAILDRVPVPEFKERR